MRTIERPIFQSVTHAAPIPTPFVVLGAGGLIPFIAGASAAWFGPRGDYAVVLFWLAGYAMVILSFVGALHWAVAMMDPRATDGELWATAGWSVLPALLAWATLALPTVTALRLMAGMFVLQLAMDRRLAWRYPVPAWFLRLRIALTTVAAACLAIASYA